jgi:hypothetical protein
MAMSTTETRPREAVATVVLHVGRQFNASEKAVVEAALRWGDSGASSASRPTRSHRPLRLPDEPGASSTSSAASAQPLAGPAAT